MSDFGQFDKAALDRYITGNYGEDQMKPALCTCGAYECNEPKPEHMATCAVSIEIEAEKRLDAELSIAELKLAVNLLVDRANAQDEQLSRAWRVIRGLRNRELRKDGAGFVLYDSACLGCQDLYVDGPDGERSFGPRHEASPGCQSGRRNHCTCDSCF